MGTADTKSVPFIGWHSSRISRGIHQQHGQAHRVVGEDRMIPFVLWLLATVDSAFIGYREAAGRNALIEKRSYFRHALIRGALMGQVVVLIVGVIAAVALVSARDPRALFSELE